MPKRPIQVVIKVGNSLAVVLPKNITKELGIGRGDVITFAVYGENSVVVRKLTSDEIKQLQPEHLKY